MRSGRQTCASVERCSEVVLTLWLHVPSMQAHPHLQFGNVPPLRRGESAQGPQGRGNGVDRGMKRSEDGVSERLEHPSSVRRDCFAKHGEMPGDRVTIGSGMAFEKPRGPFDVREKKRDDP